MFVIQDSLGFWIPRRRLRIPGTGFQSLSSKLESGSQSLVRFRIAKPRILDSWEKCSRIPYWTSQNFADSLPRGNSVHLGKKITVCVLRWTLMIRFHSVFDFSSAIHISSREPLIINAYAFSCLERSVVNGKYVKWNEPWTLLMTRWL